MMRYLYKELTNLNTGDNVEVNLEGNAANVMLLDALNFDNYKNQRQFSYAGGRYTQSPVSIIVPSAGTWFLVIDLGGVSGQVKASYRVIPKQVHHA